MTTEEQQPSTFASRAATPGNGILRGIMAVLAAMPHGTTVPEDRLGGGQRARRKWMLKYGREAPL